MYNVLYHLFSDEEKPKLIKCPDDITVKSDNDFEWVSWQEPEFTDNCGDYPKCHISITNQYSQNPLRVPTGIKYPVEYTAIDPSNNDNKECSFTVTVKSKYQLY